MTILDELTEYSHSIIDRKIIACQKHIWACMRFLNDLECSEHRDPDFRYIFIPEKAERFLRWMRLFKHRKGILKGKQIEPDIIQKFVCGNIYGWYHRDTGYRRFNKMYWQVARKNAKSQTLACMGSYETLAFDESGQEAAETYVAATKTEQARIVYDETVAMLQGCAILKGKFRVAYGRIAHEKTGSVMRPLSEEDRKTGDGLNPQCGIIDEYHAHETSELYDVLDSGMGARAQPLLAIITTAGFELNNPCYRVEYDLVSRILDPDSPVKLDSYFAMINELDKNLTSEKLTVGGREIPPGEIIDDINDPTVWVKANPIICSYPEGIDYLKKKLAEAKEAPEKMKNFLTKHMNVWVNERESGYMNMQKWGICAVDKPPFELLRCWIGLDLSSKIDLTSCAFEFTDGQRYHAISHSFMPSDTLNARVKQDKIPYDLWVKGGFITLTEGAVVDYRAVMAYFLSLLEERGWYCEEICLDPWGATQISADLADQGKTVVEIVQGIKTLSEPTKNLREMVYSGRFTYERNPVLAWSMGNAIIREDHNKNIMLDKAKSKQRIDPAAALVNAHTRAMLNTESVYNTRGMRSL